VGQALVFAPVIANAYGSAWPMQWFVIASTLIGLLLPALLITWLVDGGPGLRRLWQRVVRLRVGLGWYIGALLGIPLVAAGFTVLIEGWPTSASASTLLGALWPHFLLPFLVTFVPNNWWEEVAWMGFVQARLQSWRGPVVAALISGPLFALQHIALVVGNSVLVAAVLMGVTMVLAIPFRFLTGWFYNRTGSLFLVGLLHAAGNAVAGGSGFQTGYLRSLYPDSSIAGVAHLLAFAVIGLLAVIATRGRLGHGRAAAETGTRA
jgi:membrane protease YdiL (CAAX protease family)